MNPRNNTKNIKPGDTLVVWNDNDKKKLHLMITKLYALDGQIYITYGFIALNNTSYIHKGCNHINSDRKMNGLTNFSSIKHIVKLLNKAFDHVEKEPSVTLPIK